MSCQNIENTNYLAMSQRTMNRLYINRTADQSIMLKTFWKIRSTQFLTSTIYDLSHRLVSTLLVINTWFNHV